MIYFDTSALAKKYVNEIGTEEIRGIIDSGSTIVTSKLTYAEMLSAFARRTRAGDISESEFDQLANDFESDWQSFHAIDFQDELFALVKQVIRAYALRGADSIHLASALWIRDSFKENITFVASDDSLIKAAHAEGLQVINQHDE